MMRSLRRWTTALSASLRGPTMRSDRATSSETEVGSSTPTDCNCHPAYHDLGVHAPGRSSDPTA